MEPRASLHPSVRLVADELAPLERPLLFAAFSGAHGDTAAASLTYLAAQWDAEQVAAIEPEDYLNFVVTRPIVRNDDGQRVIDWPETAVFVARPEGVDRDIVLLVGPEPHLRWRQYTEAIETVMRTLGIEDAVLVSSFTGATPHTRPTPVHLVGADDSIASIFALPTRQPRYQGPATYGMALVVMLREAGFRVASLSAIAPFYVGVDPNPYAVKALVGAIDRGLGSSTATDELDERVAEVDEHATAAMRQSEQLTTFVHNLEQQFDETNDIATPVARANPLDTLSVDDLIGDVESFLRSRPETPGPGREGDSQPR